MVIKAFLFKFIGVWFFGFLFWTSSVYAYPVTDFTQKPLAVFENTNTMLQRMQFMDMGSVTRSIYTFQGDYRNVRGKWGNYLRSFNWYISLSKKENYSTTGDRLLSLGLGSNIRGVQTGVALSNITVNPTKIKESFKKKLMKPTDSEKATKLTEQELKNIQTAQQEANRNAVIDGYSLGLAMQEEAVNFEEEKLSAIRQMSDSAETLAEGIAAQTEGMNLIASQININNLMKASELEMIATDSLKQVDQ